MFDTAARVSQRFDHETERTRWRNSEDGKREAEREVANLLGEIETIAREIGARTGIQLEIRRGQDSIVLAHQRGSLTVGWGCTFANTLSRSGLIVKIWDRRLHQQGLYFDDGFKPQEVEERRFNADLGLGRKPGWSEKEDEAFLTSSQLANQCLKSLLEQIDSGDRVSPITDFDDDDDSGW